MLVIQQLFFYSRYDACALSRNILTVPDPTRFARYTKKVSKFQSPCNHFAIYTSNYHRLSLCLIGWSDNNSHYRDDRYYETHTDEMPKRTGPAKVRQKLAACMQTRNIKGVFLEHACTPVRWTTLGNYLHSWRPHQLNESSSTFFVDYLNKQALDIIKKEAFQWTRLRNAKFGDDVLLVLCVGIALFFDKICCASIGNVEGWLFEWYAKNIVFNSVYLISTLENFSSRNCLAWFK